VSDDRETLLTEIAEEVRGCTLCRLCEGRTCAVPGEGPAAARVMFVGEGPGAQEDRQGRPFVGNAGSLLNQMLLQARLRRPEVFITNIVKCRPPNNRDPQPDEIEACSSYLDAQIALLQPQVICLLGRPATQTLLDPTAAIGKVHGRAFEQGGMVYFPVYHPAAALHNPGMRSRLEGDFLALGRLLQERAD
jgi:DNA polymerase